ncbi:hypothetical protein GQ55_9G308200 [Panicum hallii var. hallii]|uniref:Uncharacterized protein n=1 Tax=Panicum hallii var. hallii TaxID=1504633 RepID=A0A2T7C7W9_9POAL|nr:hypothetical protein GQ55_9G308200 [Panicum hallii var. hallii]
MAREGATPPRWQRSCELRSRAAPMDSGGALANSCSRATALDGGGALASFSSTLRITVAVTGKNRGESRRGGVMEVMTVHGGVTRRRRTTGRGRRQKQLRTKITADRG